MTSGPQDLEGFLAWKPATRTTLQEPAWKGRKAPKKSITEALNRLPGWQPQEIRIKTRTETVEIPEWRRKLVAPGLPDLPATQQITVQDGEEIIRGWQRTERTRGNSYLWKGTCLVCNQATFARPSDFLKGYLCRTCNPLPPRTGLRPTVTYFGWDDPLTKLTVFYAHNLQEAEDRHKELGFAGFMPKPSTTTRNKVVWQRPLTHEYTPELESLPGLQPFPVTNTPHGWVLSGDPFPYRNRMWGRYAPPVLSLAQTDTIRTLLASNTLTSEQQEAVTTAWALLDPAANLNNEPQASELPVGLVDVSF